MSTCCNLQDYIEYQNELIDEPPYILGCETYDITVVPTTADEILAALDQHPLSDASERFLFDSIVHFAFVSDSKDNPEELESLVQEAMTAALQHQHSISKYSIVPSPVIMSAPEETIYTGALSHESSTTINEEYPPIVAPPVIEDDKDPSLLDYVLLEQKNFSLPGSEDVFVEDSAITFLNDFPSSVSPRSLVEDTRGDRKVVTFFTDYTPTEEVRSPPPQQDVATWWES